MQPYLTSFTKGDADTASEVRTLLSGVIEEVNAVKAVGPEEPLAQLDEAIGALPGAAKADLKQAKAGIGGVQAKLNKRKHLMTTWDEWLGKGVSKQEAKLKTEIEQRDEAKKELDDLESSAPAPCKDESVALLAHWRQTKNWARDVETAAVELALSLLSVGQHNISAGK